MSIKTDIHHDLIVHEVKLNPDEGDIRCLVRMAHAVRRVRNWAIRQYNESRIHHGKNEYDLLMSGFRKTQRQKKKKKKKKKKKQKEHQQRENTKMYRKGSSRTAPSFSWTAWMSSSAFSNELWGLVREYWEGGAPAMRGWRHPKQFVLSYEDLRISECGDFLCIVTDEWDYVYDSWDEEPKAEYGTIWIEMDSPLAIDNDLLIRAEIRQEGHEWFARVFEDVLPDKGENVVAVSLRRVKTAITDGRQALLIQKSGNPRLTSLPILDWVIARHAGKIVVGCGNKASEMYQDLKNLLEAMGFEFISQELADISKICPFCKHRVDGRFEYCKQCGMRWWSEIGKASNILAKFLGSGQCGGIYPHTIRIHERAEWPDW